MEGRLQGNRIDLRRGSLPVALAGQFLASSVGGKNAQRRKSIRGDPITVDTAYERINKEKKMSYLSALRRKVEEASDSSESESSEPSPVAQHSHIAAKTVHPIRHFYGSQPTSPRFSDFHSEKTPFSSVGLSTVTSFSNFASNTTSPRESVQPASALLWPLHSVTSPLPSSNALQSPQPRKVTWQENRPSEANCASNEGLFDVRQYSHLNVSEKEIKDRIRRHAEWIRRGEAGFLGKSRKSVNTRR